MKRYYKTSNGIIIKVLLDGLGCYQLNTISEKWEKDFKIWDQIKNNEIEIEEIEFIDVYDVDRKKNNADTSKYKFNHNYSGKTEKEIELSKKIEHNDKVMREFCKKNGIPYGVEISYSTRNKIGR